MISAFGKLLFFLMVCPLMAWTRKSSEKMYSQIRFRISAGRASRGHGLFDSLEAMAWSCWGAISDVVVDSCWDAIFCVMSLVVVDMVEKSRTGEGVYHIYIDL